MKAFRNTVKIFCAFCRSPKRVYSSRRIGLSHIFSSTVASGLAMFAIWREYDPRVLIVFVVFLAIAEVFVQIRWRMSLTCRQCGFDPVAYKKDPEIAAGQVKGHLKKRRENPRFLLSPALNLPTRSPEKPKQPGSLISRQI